jgi:hypothetical protein
MSKYPFRAAGLVAFALICASAAGAAGETPKATDILFERPHIAAITPGTELVYKFVHKPSDEKVLGAGFTDDITVKIESDGAAGKKNVLVQLYSGDRAREPQRITDMDGNPMLVIYLDNAVSQFRQLAGGDSTYLKGMFSRYLGSGAKIDPVTITYKGQQIDGYRVTATPYADDPAKSKMNGFEGATFTISLSDKIPGYFAQMVSMFTNTNKTVPTLQETTTLDGVGDVK